MDDPACSLDFRRRVGSCVMKPSNVFRGARLVNMDLELFTLFLNEKDGRT